MVQRHRAISPVVAGLAALLLAGCAGSGTPAPPSGDVPSTSGTDLVLPSDLPVPPPLSTGPTIPPPITDRPATEKAVVDHLEATIGTAVDRECLADAVSGLGDEDLGLLLLAASSEITGDPVLSDAASGFGDSIIGCVQAPVTEDDTPVDPAFDLSTLTIVTTPPGTPSVDPCTLADPVELSSVFPDLGPGTSGPAFDIYGSGTGCSFISPTGDAVNIAVLDGVDPDLVNSGQRARAKATAELTGAATLGVDGLYLLDEERLVTVTLMSGGVRSWDSGALIAVGRIVQQRLG